MVGGARGPELQGKGRRSDVQLQIQQTLRHGQVRPSSALYSAAALLSASSISAPFRWYKNKLEIFHGQKYNIEKEEGEFRLVIHRIGLEDAGKYQCEADERKTSAWLHVEGAAS